MPDPNLTDALRGSLRIVETQDQTNPSGFESGDSPLSEATTDSIDILLDRINSAMAEGLPEKITDETLMELTLAFRAEALRWSQEQETKKPRTRAPKKPTVEGLDL